MNNQHVKGAWNETKGKAKEEVGHATGDESLESQGVLDRFKGKVEKVAGDVKDAIKEGVDHVLEKKSKSA